MIIIECPVIAINDADQPGTRITISCPHGPEAIRAIGRPTKKLPPLTMTPAAELDLRREGQGKVSFCVPGVTDIEVDDEVRVEIQ